MRASATSKGPEWRQGTRPLALLALLPSLVGLAACQETSPPTATSAQCEGRPVRIGVASSLREIAEEVSARLAIEKPALGVEPIFGASSTHARQLRLGAPFDVLVSADAELLESLGDSGWVEKASIREIARGRLILVGRETLPLHRAPWSAEAIATRTDVERGALNRNVEKLFTLDEVKRVAVPSEIVPLGRYAREWLKEKDLLSSLTAAGKLVTTEHARANLSAVEAGHADLAFAYRSDRRLLRQAIFLGELDAGAYPPIRYVAAITRRASKCQDARTLHAAWSASATARALAKAGFFVAHPEIPRP